MLAVEFVIDASLVCISGPAYPLACLACPLPPALWLNPGCLSSCPLITTTRPGGAARAPRGEAAGSGHNAVSARAHTRYMV